VESIWNQNEYSEKILATAAFIPEKVVTHATELNEIIKEKCNT
jgi:hypothetical protein